MEFPHILTWRDSEPTNAIGWLVINNLVQDVASGGLFMHPEATVKEVAELAKAMSWKNALQEPPIGGAKGGIRFDHTHLEARGVLERFLLSCRSYIQNFWSTGADLNTDNKVIHHIICNKLKLPSGFISVGSMLSRFYGIENQTDVFLECLKHPVGHYFNISECATGYSVAMCIREFCSPSSRILIQGWGNVGRSLGYFLQSEKLGQVVGIIEKDYFIYHKEGLNINQLLAIRYSLINSSQFCVNEYLAQVEDQGYSVVRRTEMNDEEFLVSCLSEPADVFCPCAVRYAITDSVSQTLINKTFKEKKDDKPWIICGANNAMLDDARLQLKEAGISMLPEWVSSSGNTLLYNEILKHSKSLSVLPEEWLLIIKQRVHRFLEESQLESKQKGISLFEACHELIRKKLKDTPVVQKDKNLSLPGDASFLNYAKCTHNEH